MEVMIEKCDTDFNIVELIKDLMEKAEMFVDKTGIEKKAMVMTNIRTLLGNEKYSVFYPVINQTIDFIIAISRKKINLDLNKKIKKYCYCI